MLLAAYWECGNNAVVVLRVNDYANLVLLSVDHNLLFKGLNALVRVGDAPSFLHDFVCGLLNVFSRGTRGKQVSRTVGMVPGYVSGVDMLESFFEIAIFKVRLSSMRIPRQPQRIDK